jgi:L-lactate dehydrogenase complex protein LldF
MNAQPIGISSRPQASAPGPAAVVDNPFLRQSFRGAMDFLMTKRAAQFPDAEELESLRTLGEAHPPVQPRQAAGPARTSSKPT